jgi:putative OPT family oligopeptide transporter
MGVAALWELLKSDYGFKVIRENIGHYFDLGTSSIAVFDTKTSYAGGLYLQTPNASPAVMGVGFIVGFRIAAVLFCGAVTGWLVLVPLAMFLNPHLAAQLGSDTTMVDLAFDVWKNQIRPLAVGTMIVSAFYTLYNLRGSLIDGVGRALGNLSVAGDRADEDRTEKDLDFKKVFVAIALMAVPLYFLYRYFSGSWGGSILLVAVMMVIGFLFAAVAGYLVGLIGNSNNPISGLTLSALLIAAVLMVLIGVTEVQGVRAVLGVAGVVCCMAGIAGDMMQDLKVGHILGGTPWRMQVGEIIGVIVAAAAMPFVLWGLNSAYEIGSEALPAPQAGLMALMAKGIVGGEMAWPLVIVGMLLGVALILISAPSPMLIAVGMYLPFATTSAVFAGGVIRAVLDKLLARRQASAEERVKAENAGVLVSSGLIAGEALMAVALAFVLLYGKAVMKLGENETMLPHLADSFWLGLLIYPLLAYLLVWLPLKRMRSS